MTALGLTLAGLAPGVVALVVYWFGRDIADKRRLATQEMEALASSPGGQAFARALRPLAAMTFAQPGPVHIEALKLRAAMRSTTLRHGGDSAAAAVIDNAIRVGDREALEALLREQDSP